MTEKFAADKGVSLTYPNPTIKVSSLLSVCLSDLLGINESQMGSGSL